MIQLNLLPDVKLEYIKARRSQRLVMLVASVVTVVSILIMVALLANVKGLQAKHLSDLDRDIRATTAKLQGNKDLNQVLTIQNQLNSLPSLDNQKPVASRLLGSGTTPGFLTQVTPSDVSIGTAALDFTANTINIQGTAKSLYSVNQYADTLKFTKYILNGDKSNEKLAFSNVVLSNFSYSQDGTVSYTLTCGFDPSLFDIQSKIDLDVPQNLITTRSQLDKPNILFNGKNEDTQKTGTGQ